MPALADSLDDRAILVTGCAGFIGSHLTRTLATDHDVTLLDDLSTGSSATISTDTTFVHAGIQDTDTVDELVADDHVATIEGLGLDRSRDA